MFLLSNRQVGTAGIVPNLRISSAESLVWTFHEDGAQWRDHILATVVAVHRKYSFCKVITLSGTILQQELQDLLSSKVESCHKSFCHASSLVELGSSKQDARQTR